MSPATATRAARPPKKKVLLVHSVGHHRDLRANVLRKCGCEVVCANDCYEARLLWHPDVYDLVLLDGEQDTAANEELSRDMTNSHPNEKVAFLVGRPALLASAPAVGGGNGIADSTKSYHQLFKKLMSDACEVLPHRHGFMEAVWRMYLVRSRRSPSVSTRPDPVIPVTVAIAQPNAESAISFGDRVRQAESETEVNDDNGGA